MMCIFTSYTLHAFHAWGLARYVNRHLKMYMYLWAVERCGANGVGEKDTSNCSM